VQRYEWEESFQRLTRWQEGVIAKFQLAELALPPHVWRYAQDSSRYEAMSGRVLRDLGAPQTEAQRVIAAVLDASPAGVLAGPSTLAWFGVHGYTLRNLHVARPRGVSGTPAQLAKLHSLRDLRPVDVLAARGAPTMTPLRAIWMELAPYAPERRRERGIERGRVLLDAAHRLKLVSWAALRESVDDLQTRGRPATCLMRILSEERPPGSSPTDSRNEDKFEEILTGERMPLPLRQRTLGGEALIGRCDFRYPEVPLAIEVNSLLFHTTPSDVAADLRRYNALMIAGFTVAVIWEPDLWGRPRGVTRTISAAQQAVAAGRRVVLHSPGCPWPDAIVVDDDWVLG
jgi:hypothetical protein